MFGLVPFRFNNGENNRGLSINDMFNDFFNDDMLSEFNSSGSFKTDIKENPEGYVIHAELPGVNKEDINIDYNNNYLTENTARLFEKEFQYYHFQFQELCKAFLLRACSIVFL